MVKRMLIDATHPEETRVAIVSGNRLEEFDFETSTKKQLKGNIYLAKVTRVEPSLQAAFVEYGGNRHGFLAFSEIHPDYYRIPIADRQALIAAEASDGDADAVIEAEDGDQSNAASDGENGADNATGERGGANDNGSDAPEGDGAPGDTGNGAEAGRGGRGGRGSSVETVGGNEIDELTRRRRLSPRNYRIQEVISRRQILLVQVAKEERGTKGAALTTYISLAGRYCVLMPNTPRGGGISRKITSPGDRKRLKGFLDELDISEGMAVILRTAGMERSKAEIKRDYEYLVRHWEEVRELTLKSTAPALVHEEANLIKRSIRDLYSRDIDEIYVDGDAGYRTAKDFMRMLIPSHAKRVQPYRDPGIPLFHRYQVETEIDDMHSPVVHLKSGGYIVIDSTEALVAIDVNSGRATRERNIEETARRTNVEAAEEVARQLRLRDLAGLIVIDFIDMEDSRNRQRVEKRLKESMRGDRARIQLGRISAFGLLELSRQRLRPSLIEASMRRCPACGGSGHIRSTESTTLHVLRAIEEEGMRRRSREISVYVPTEVALYVLNHKRAALAEIEGRYGFQVMIAADDTLVPPDMRIERVTGKPSAEAPTTHLEAGAGMEAAAPAEDDEGRKRRPRRRRDKDTEAEPETRAEAGAEAGAEAAEETSDEAAEEREAGAEAVRKPRRRGRRGGRRRGRRGEEAGVEAKTESETAAGPAGPGAPTAEAPAPAEIADAAEMVEETPPAGEEDGEQAAPAKPARKRATRSRRKPAAVEPAEDKPVEAAKRPTRRRRAPRKTAEPDQPAGPDTADAGAGESEPQPDAPARPPKEIGSGAQTQPRTGNGETTKTAAEAEREPAPATRAKPAKESAPAPAGGQDPAPLQGADDDDAPSNRRGWWNRIIER